MASQSVPMENNLLLLLACNFTPAGGETHYKVEVIANQDFWAPFSL